MLFCSGLFGRQVELLFIEPEIEPNRLLHDSTCESRSRNSRDSFYYSPQIMPERDNLGTTGNQREGTVPLSMELKPPLSPLSALITKQKW
jgi:hypothetical protein